LIEVVAPVVPLQADFTVSADFAGTDCTNVDRSDDNPSLVIVVNGVNPVGAQLTYAVTSTTSSFNINPTPIANLSAVDLYSSCTTMSWDDPTTVDSNHKSRRSTL